MSKGHGLDSPPQHSFQDSAACAGLQLSRAGGPGRCTGDGLGPQPSQGSWAKKPDPQLRGKYLPLQLAASPASEPSSGDNHYAVWSHAPCILMNESRDRLNLKEELQLSGWVKGSQGMLSQPGYHKERREGSYFHLEKGREGLGKEGQKVGRKE